MSLFASKTVSSILAPLMQKIDELAAHAENKLGEVAAADVVIAKQNAIKADATAESELATATVANLKAVFKLS